VTITPFPPKQLFPSIIIVSQDVAVRHFLLSSISIHINQEKEKSISVQITGAYRQSKTKKKRFVTNGCLPSRAFMAMHLI
jgi:hypothetical protein